MTDNKHGQIVSGWLQGCTQLPSPNCGPRPAGGSVELVVVHNISLPPGEFGGPHIEELFTNSLDPKAHAYFAEIADLRVSAHFLIRRDGEVIQFVPTNKNAWHAGNQLGVGVKNVMILVSGLNWRVLTPMFTPERSTAR